MAHPMVKRLIFRYCLMRRRGDGEVTLPRTDGKVRIRAKVLRDAVKYTSRAEARKYAGGSACWRVKVIMLPRKSAKYPTHGYTRTANGHTWPG